MSRQQAKDERRPVDDDGIAAGTGSHAATPVARMSRTGERRDAPCLDEMARRTLEHCERRAGAAHPRKRCS